MMKEITRIHLAQTPYNVEVTAKKELEQYLNAIAKALGADEDALREIESRMVEMLIERGVVDEKVITMADVAAIKQQLGAPGDFADEDAVTVPGEKRLMRDTRSGMIGGVLSGFAAYTGVDVVWWRIAAVILALISFGTVMLLYVVLWIVMPKATSAAERLQMRGVMPSLENIHEEANRDTSETPVQKKPLVVLLRIIGVISLVGMMFAPIAIVGLGLFGITTVWQVQEWLANGWLLLAAGLGTLSGLSLVILLALGVYGLTAWRSTRAMAITATVVIVTGLLTFVGAMGAGYAGSGQVQRDIEAHTEKHQQSLNDLAGAQQLTIESANASVPVEYHVTDSAPYAVIESLSGSGERTKLNIETGAEKAVILRVTGPGTQDCNRHMFAICDIERAKIRVYGPALQDLKVDGISLQYYAASQDALRVSVGKGANVALYGTVRSLDASVADGAMLGADGATVYTAKLAATQSSHTTFGVLQSLTIAAPASCPADSEAEVDVQKVTALKTVDFVTQQEEIHENCVTIHVDEPNPTVIN